MRTLTILLIALLCGCSDNRLHSAAKANDIPTIKRLISEGSNINGEYLQWGTPLHVAAQHQHIEAMDILISNGADINNKSGVHDFTPLHRTIGKPWDLKATFFLIEKGADINARDSKNRSITDTIRLYGPNEIGEDKTRMVITTYENYVLHSGKY
jgi:ankyrin repeat protein